MPGRAARYHHVSPRAEIAEVQALRHVDVVIDLGEIPGSRLELCTPHEPIAQSVHSGYQLGGDLLRDRNRRPAAASFMESEAFYR